MRSAINTDTAPQAFGPYSQAVDCNDTLWCSGQLGLSPAGQLAPDPKRQTEQALDNLEEVCTRAGYKLTNAIMATVYVTDLTAFDVINEVFAARFKEPHPARACVQVAALPKGATVEIALVVDKAI